MDWMIASEPGIHSEGTLTDARCLECGYALRGLTGDRCPECGREFDHGVKITLSSDDLFRSLFGYGQDHGPGFLFREQDGECSRCDFGRALGGGWYACE
jgi:hypothetical protein